MIDSYLRRQEGLKWAERYYWLMRQKLRHDDDVEGGGGAFGAFGVEGGPRSLDHPYASCSSSGSSMMIVMMAAIF